MPEPYRVMILLAWCPMRFGELTELRRMDIDTREEVIRIRRAVVRAGGRIPSHDTKVRRRRTRCRDPAPLAPRYRRPPNETRWRET